jgi:hypothetical protein
VFLQGGGESEKREEQGDGDAVQIMENEPFSSEGMCIAVRNIGEKGGLC